MSHRISTRFARVQIGRTAPASGLALFAAFGFGACQASLGLDDYRITAGGSATDVAGSGGEAGEGGSAPSGGSGGSLSAGAGGAGDGGTGSPGGAAGDAPDSSVPPACVPQAELSAPLLLGPTRGAYSGSLYALAARGSLRPTLSWAAVPSECSVTYHVQMDNSCARGDLLACAFDSAEVDAPGIAETAFSPEQALVVSLVRPVGDLFAWRVNACDGVDHCSPWSEVRSLEVGRVLGDLDGDAYADVAVADTPSNQLLFRGSDHFNDGITSGLPTDMFALRWLGDVNGDGYGDLGGLGSNTTLSGTAGKVLFGSNGASGLPITVTGSEGTSSTSPVFGPLGDINGDGFADVIVHLNNHAIADVYLGASDFVGSVPSFSIPAPLDNIYSLPSSGPVGDIDRDGYADAVLVTTPLLDAAQVLFGSVSPGPTLSAPIAFGAGCNDAFITRGGDLDADGFGDFVVVCPGLGVFVRFGGASLGSEWSATRLAANVDNALGDIDLDADGVVDLLVGLTDAPPWVFRGGAGFNLDSPVAGALSSLGALPTLGAAEGMAAADVNGDGALDLFVNSDNVQWAPGTGALDPTFSPLLTSATPVPGNLGY